MLHHFRYAGDSSFGRDSKAIAATLNCSTQATYKVLNAIRDKVQINGRYYKGQEGKAQATRLIITGSEPLGAPVSKEKRQLLDGAK